jgi:hypothetical protein
MNDMKERIRSALRPYRSGIELRDLAPFYAVPDEERGNARIDRQRQRREPRTSVRVLSAVAILTLFAVVVAVFVMPVLRLGAPQTPPLDGGVVLPLWPVQTADDLTTFQAQADEGQHPEALDPQLLAKSFARQVLGWKAVFAVQHDEPISSLCGAAVPGNSGPELQVGCWSPGMTEQAFRSQAQAGSTMVTFALFPCEPGPCDIKFFSPVDLTMYQPVPGGVWAVLAASSEWLDLKSQPGQSVHDSATVSVSGSIAQGDDFRLGATGAGSCTFADSTAAYDTTGQPPDAEPLNATLEVHVGDAQGCSGSSPGYVWAAESATSLDGVDPLHGGGPELRVFSAVPVSLIAP